MVRSISARLLIPVLATVCAGCDSLSTGPGQEDRTFTFDFTSPAASAASSDASLWTAGFADFAPHMEEMMELQAGHVPLPEGVGPAGGYGLHIAGTNHSDDLFMFWKTQVEGLDPHTDYQVRFQVEFASRSPAGCVGVGGAPGESVWVKGGATLVEPEVELGQMGSSDYWVMNVDKGIQMNDGTDAVILGDVGVGDGNCHDQPWELKEVSGPSRLDFTTDGIGRAWLLVGTDSGFEGRTGLYYTRVRATFQPR